MGDAGPGAGATYGLAGGRGGGRLIDGSLGVIRLGGLGCVDCANAGETEPTRTITAIARAMDMRSPTIGQDQRATFVGMSCSHLLGAGFRPPADHPERSGRRRQARGIVPG